MRNIEKLRNYFLGKDPQLKETMADNSLRLIGIPGREYVLRVELLKRLGLLKKELTDKDEELQGLIDDLETALNGLSGDVADLDTWKNNTDFVLANDLATALSDYYTKEQIDEIISVLPTFDIQVVEQLPAPIVAEQGVLYLVPSNDPGDVNYYDEYIVVEYQGAKSWEKVGSTAIDMSNYYTKSDTDTLLAGKQGTLTAGSNVTIDADNVIAATDTTYSNFVGTDGSEAGASGLVPAPATTDSGKYLKADGTWGTPSGGGGTSDYADLTNKPSINSVTLSGDKTTYDLLPQIPYTEMPEPANPYVSIQDLVDAEGIYKTDITVTFTGGNWSDFPIHPNSIIKVSQHGSTRVTVNVIIIDWDNIVKCSGRLTVATDTWDNFEKKTYATTDEIPTITYSTTERVVGTWIDGKPLYEKVIREQMPITSTMGTWASRYVYLDNDVESVIIMSATLDRSGETSPKIEMLPIIRPLISSGKVTNLIRTQFEIILSHQSQMETGKTKAINLMNSDTGITNSYAVLVIRYTKSTD